MLASYYAEAINKNAGSLFQRTGFDEEVRLAHSHSGTTLSDLPPMLRNLLVTDGTVTKTLESYYWEPVKVDTISQVEVKASGEISWLNCRRGTNVMTRDVLLRGVNSGKIYAKADSVLMPEYIPEEFFQKLSKGIIGIGAVIRDCGLESYREILEIGMYDCEMKINANDMSPAGPVQCVYRTYRIYLGGQPAMLITEYFPLALYL